MAPQRTRNVYDCGRWHVVIADDADDSCYDPSTRLRLRLAGALALQARQGVLHLRLTFANSGPHAAPRGLGENGGMLSLPTREPQLLLDDGGAG
jgi:hypothetical protein